jgi:SAM-dependent methyltransferase
MAEIEKRIESTVRTPDYTTMKFGADEIAAGKHRQFVGGEWEALGELQIDFLKRHGLQPEHRFLDVGCGSLRAGRHLVEYLNPGNYFGIDANIGVIQAGYDAELTDEQRARLPVGNLRANERFDGDFGVQFDMAIAQSVFSHVSLNHVRLCLYRIAKVVKSGGRFYATFFEQPPKVPLDTIVQRGGRRPQFTERNLFWYYRTDIEWAGGFAPWHYRYIGDWGHPRGQNMVEFTRVADPQWDRSHDGHSSGSAQSAPVSFRYERPHALWRARRWIARRIAPY